MAFALQAFAAGPNLVTVEAIPMASHSAPLKAKTRHAKRRCDRDSTPSTPLAQQPEPLESTDDHLVQGSDRFALRLLLGSVVLLAALNLYDLIGSFFR
jgi:hypothetical protein